MAGLLTHLTLPSSHRRVSLARRALARQRRCGKSPAGRAFSSPGGIGTRGEEAPPPPSDLLSHAEAPQRAARRPSWVWAEVASAGLCRGSGLPASEGGVLTGAAFPSGVCGDCGGCRSAEVLKFLRPQPLEVGCPRRPRQVAGRNPQNPLLAVTPRPPLATECANKAPSTPRASCRSLGASRQRRAGSFRGRRRRVHKGHVGSEWRREGSRRRAGLGLLASRAPGTSRPLSLIW